jgi:hypothetical protein
MPSGTETTLAEVGKRNFFWSPQSQFRNLEEKLRNRNSATFKGMLLHNRNSAIPQSQFFLKSATSNPQLESFTSTISGIFLATEYLKIIHFYRQVFFATQGIFKTILS